MKKLLFSFAIFAATAVCFAGTSPGKIQEVQGDLFQEESVVEVAVEENSTPDTKRPAYEKIMPEGEPVEFKEIWAYVMESRLDEFNNDMPITDFCYFGASIGIYGDVEGYPNPARIANFRGRKHLVVTCDGRALSHFALDPHFGINQKIRDSLVSEVKKNYDGLQIDFELVPKKDAHYFITFLKDLRYLLGNEKWLTVAVPARVKALENDVYDYKSIEPYVDRLIIMAYDEHWSTSKPGPVASMDWCKKIADYCQSVIPPRKFVIGMPFYGRIWQDGNVSGGWYFSGINRIMNENDCHEIERVDGVPHFTFKKEITATGYFDDVYSLVQRARMYDEMGIKKCAVWRIGQEDPEFWNWVKLIK